MIEVVALAGAINSISGAITSSIQAGRNLSQLAPQIAKLGALDSQVQAAEAGKHKGILSKLTSTEAEALAITQAKMAHKQAMEKLRETMLLFVVTLEIPTYLHIYLFPFLPLKFLNNLISKTDIWI